MRLSVEKNDPGYSDYAPYAEVYLNGKKLDNCVTADDSEGWVVVYKEINGHFIEVMGSGLAKEKLYGDVRIVIPEIEDQQEKETKDHTFLSYVPETVIGVTPKSDLEDANQQMYKSLSDKELQDIMDLAVEFENYEAAQRVKEVLEERKSNSYES